MATEAQKAGEASKEYFGMSDEDFLKMNAPSTAASTEDEQDPAEKSGSASKEETQADDGDATSQAAPAAEGEGGDDESAEKTNKNKESKDAVDEDPDASAASAGTNADTNPVVDKTKPSQEKAIDPAVGDKSVGDKTKTKPDPSGSNPKADAEGEKDKKDGTAESGTKPVDYEQFFKQVMAPFKANGRTIELKTPEEAIRLMQMGAGYGRKIQDLQPHLKVIRMLEKNDLLDEAKLSLLIDVNQKNPEAIKKIIKDSGIDPLDLNMEDNVNYIPTNHAVSDKEMTFQSALSDIQSHETGKETLRLINQTWDKESVALLWESPQILGVIQAQRDNGIYDQIAAEIDRQKLLGQIPTNTPFLQAYKAAGDYLQATNGFKAPEGQAAPIQKQPGETQQKQVIATRPAAPKAQVQNGDKAAAASPTKTNGARKAGATVNPLEMADDDFLKQFKDRL